MINMINTRISKLLCNPNLTTTEDRLAIEEQIEQTPFFYPLRLLLFKSYEDKSNQEYKDVLQLASLYTPNRTVLFNFIHEGNSIVKPKEVQVELVDKVLISDEKQQEELLIPKKTEKESEFNDVNKEEIAIIEDETLEIEDKSKISTEELLIPKEIELESKFTDINKQEVEFEAEKPLEIERKNTSKKKDKNKSKKGKGKGIQSFHSWLENKIPQDFLEENEKEAKINELFSEDKIREIDGYLNDLNINTKSDDEEYRNIAEGNSIQVTETLANLYLQQKNYKKAIWAYKQLMSNNPEKSSLFANTIKNIKKIK